MHNEVQVVESARQADARSGISVHETTHIYIYIYIYIYQYMERRCFRKCSMKGIRA